MTESSADSGIFSQKPALNHSRLHFQDVTFVQRWTYYSGIDEAAVLPALTLIDVVNTTIAFQSCNFSSYQLIASHTPKPFPPLLLTVSGSFNSSTLLLYNFMTQVHPIGTSGAAEVLLPPALTFGDMSASLLQFRDSTFTNLLAVGQFAQQSSTSSAHNSNSNKVAIGCNTWWCVDAACSLLGPQSFLNSSVIPSGITFSAATSTCTTVVSPTATPSNLVMFTGSTTRTATLGIHSTATTSLTKTSPPNGASEAPLRRQQFSSPHQTQTAVASLTYVALVSTVGRGAVPSLQRAGGALRLASRCYQLGVIDDDSTPQSVEDNSSGTSATQDQQDDPTFSALADNPLFISLPVGASSAGGPSLDYAAGAAFGNLLIVIVVAAMLHCLYLVQKRFACRSHRGNVETMSSSPTRKTLRSVAAAVIALLPASPLPGSIAVVYVVLLQPGVGACIALIVSPVRNVNSVVCAALLMAAWLIFPVYCADKILIQARSQTQPAHGSAPSESKFLVRSVDARHVPRGSASHDSNSSVLNRLASVWLAAASFLFEPSCEWTAFKERHQHSLVAFLLRNMRAVFAGYVGQREWYFLVEWGIAALSGAVVGAAEAISAAATDSDAACEAAQWGTASVIAIGVLELICCGVLRPFAVRMDVVSVVVMGVLGLLSEALSMSASTMEASASVGTAASIVSILFLALAMLNGVTISMATARKRSISNNSRPLQPMKAAGKKVGLRVLIELICQQRRQQRQQSVQRK